MQTNKKIEALQEPVAKAELVVQSEQTKLDNMKKFMSDFQTNKEGAELRKALVDLVTEKENSGGFYKIPGLHDSQREYAKTGELGGISGKGAYEINTYLNWLVRDQGPQYQQLSPAAKQSLAKFLDYQTQIKNTRPLEDAQNLLSAEQANQNLETPSLKANSFDETRNAAVSGSVAGLGLLANLKKKKKSESELESDPKDPELTNEPDVFTSESNLTDSDSTAQELANSDSLPQAPIPEIPEPSESKPSQDTKEPKSKFGPGRLKQLAGVAVLGTALTVAGGNFLKGGAKLPSFEKQTTTTETIKQAATLEELLTDANKERLHYIYLNVFKKSAGSPRGQLRLANAEQLVAEGYISKIGEMNTMLLGIAEGETFEQLRSEVSPSDQALLKEYARLWKARKP